MFLIYFISFVIILLIILVIIYLNSTIYKKDQVVKLFDLMIKNEFEEKLDEVNVVKENLIKKYQEILEEKLIKLEKKTEQEYVKIENFFKKIYH